MSTNPTMPDVQIPPDISSRLKRKLDKHLAAKERKANDGRKRSGRKPEFAKHLTRNTAAVVLKRSNATQAWLELLQSPDARLRFEVLRYLTDRLEGKAFTAINPDERPQAPVNQDNRLQVAIQNLIVPAAKPRKALKAQPLALPAQPNPIQAAAKPGDGQEN